MRIRPVVVLLFSAVTIASVLPAADLTTYRNFRIGMSTGDVAKETGLAVANAKLLSSRPQRVEEMDWRIDWTPPSTGTQADPVRQILFGFYNTSLYEVTVTYDRDQTSGLTDSDMIDALSGIYGTATKPDTPEMTFKSGYNKIVKVVARWEDARDQVSLIQLPYHGGFGLVLSAKDNQILADQAIVDSDRLDRAEAPRNELALQAKQIADAQAIDEKARSLNKPGFRP